MPTKSETSDQAVLELLRRLGPLTISQLMEEMGVTANAVRQRLARLMAQGLVSRQVDRDKGQRERGRPVHRYSLTDEARRQAGNNFADLALVLWREIRAVRDPEVRRGLLGRIADAFARQYREKITGATAAERMRSLSELFAERRVPLAVTPDANGQLPVLKVEDCPYPELAEEDRGICAVEKMMFSQLLNTDVRLTECRLDGHVCCEFETVECGDLSPVSAQE